MGQSSWGAHPDASATDTKFSETESGKVALARGHTALSERMGCDGARLSLEVRQAIQKKKSEITGQPLIVLTEDSSPGPARVYLFLEKIVETKVRMGARILVVPMAVPVVAMKKGK